MKRRTLTLAAAAAAAALLTSACGSDGGAGAAPDPGTLTVYSSQHENLTKAWADGSPRRPASQVQIRSGKDASMGSQIVAEGDRRRPTSSSPRTPRR